MSSKAIAAAAAALLVAGCSTVNKPIGVEDPGFGEAVKFDAAMQIINPDPVYPEDSAQPGDSGKKGADAVKRYREDKVNARHKSEASTQSRGLSTTSGTGGGGGPQ
jgi:hypothetical protein